MEEIKDLFETHLNLYPKMEPQDCIKLLYQNEFGPSHAIYPIQSFEALQKEVEHLEESDEPIFLPIGNYLYRVNLYSALKEYELEEIYEWFIETANTHKGSLASYMKKIKDFKKCYASLPFTFTEEALDSYLAYYRGLAYPAVHHSKTYVENYHPHYRIVRKNIWK